MTLIINSFYFFYFQSLAKFNGANYGYYHGNTTGNYGAGTYNQAFTASPSQNGVLNPASQIQQPLQNLHGGPPNTLPKPTYDNFNPTLQHVNEGQSLNIDKSAVPSTSAIGYSSTNRYSLHVRASPISPTYSQFSSGVSVKNAYPSSAILQGGNGYGGGG